MKVLKSGFWILDKTEKVFHAFDSLVDRVSHGFWILSGIFITLMSFVVAYGVVMRYVFRAQDRYSSEITCILMLGCVVFAYAYTQRRGRHIRIDLLDRRFTPTVQGILRNIIGPLAGLTFVVVLFWTSWLDSAYAWKIDQHTTSLFRISTFPLKVSITVGIGLLCLVLVTQILRFLLSFRKKDALKE